MARCPAKPKLSTRPLLTRRQAQSLESTFKMLANATRLRMLHELARAGEISVSDLASAIGMKPQAVSNQLQRLADRGIVEAWRDGTQVWYSIVDPCVVGLLDQGWCLAEESQVCSFGRLEGAAS
jgi:DNA-binding transcriptional ArsR family regulator